MTLRSHTLTAIANGLIACLLLPQGLPAVATLPSELGSRSKVAEGDRPPLTQFIPSGIRLANAVPVAGVLMRIDNVGGQVTLRGSSAGRGQLMSTPGDRLRVPARSGANIGFRPANSSGTIPNYLVQAGSPTIATDYWYPCNGPSGRFVIGWSVGSSTPTCSQVRLGQTFRVPNTRADKAARSRGAVPVDPAALPSHRLKANFPDTQGHWAEAEIDALSNQGIISGYYEDGTFRPDAPVTRAEFAAMVTKAFGDRAPVRDPQDFPDTQWHWASAAIRTAYSLGFISGYPDGTFQPQGNISRAEAVVALASGLALAGDTSLDGFYVDAPEICGDSAPYYWACSQISAATSNGIRIQGPNPDQFRPAQQASRADIAVFIYQALPGQNGSNADKTDIVIEPTSVEAAWVLADVTDGKVEVTVLGGTVLIGPEVEQKQVVSAGQRYILEASDLGFQGGTITTLSAEDRTAIANSSEVTTFLDPNSWLPEIYPQLGVYESQRNALATPVELPKLELVGIEFVELEQTSPRGGRFRVVGTIVNNGGPFISTPGTQAVVLDEIPPIQGDVSTSEVARQEFQNLAPGEQVQVVYERDWDNAVFEQPNSNAAMPGYVLRVDIDYANSIDSNPSNDALVGWIRTYANEVSCFFGGCLSR